MLSILKWACIPAAFILAFCLMNTTAQRDEARRGALVASNRAMAAETSLGACRGNAVTLEAKIANQNGQIERLKADGDRLTTEADRRVAEAEERARKASRAGRIAATKQDGEACSAASTLIRSTLAEERQ